MLRCGPVPVFVVMEAAIETIDLISSALGLNQSGQDLSALQMGARAFVVYFYEG